MVSIKTEPEAKIMRVDINPERDQDRDRARNLARLVMETRLKPRSARTPMFEALAVLAKIDPLYRELLPGESFAKNVFIPFWSKPGFGSGDIVRKECEDLAGIEDNGQAAQVVRELMRFDLVTAYCVDAMKAHIASQSTEAWTLFADACYWLGIVTERSALANSLETQGVSVRENASRAGRASHAQDYAFRAVVETWCATNLDNFPSMDKAAATVAGELVPREFSTVRKWIGAWRRAHPRA